MGKELETNKVIFDTFKVELPVEEWIRISQGLIDLFSLSTPALIDAALNKKDAGNITSVTNFMQFISSEMFDKLSS